MHLHQQEKVRHILLYILNIFYDEDEQEIKIKVNMSKMLKVSLILSIIIFFILKKSPFF